MAGKKDLLIMKKQYEIKSLAEDMNEVDNAKDNRWIDCFQNTKIVLVDKFSS